MMKFYLYIAIAFLGNHSFAYESMHEKTPVGKIVVVDLPARTALETSTDKSYFSENNGLFRKLFRYINQNDISMTTPVEADIKPGKMRFFVGTKDLAKNFKDSDQVKIRKLAKKSRINWDKRWLHREKISGKPKKSQQCSQVTPNMKRLVNPWYLLERSFCSRSSKSQNSHTNSLDWKITERLLKLKTPQLK